MRTLQIMLILASLCCLTLAITQYAWANLPPCFDQGGQPNGWCYGPTHIQCEWSCDPVEPQFDTKYYCDYYGVSVHCLAVCPNPC